MVPDGTLQRKYLGRYELVEQLGKGGMGEVWLAKISGAAGFEKPCIVKTVLPELAGDPQFVDRFLHEAKVLVHLVHSNIAQVYDMGEAEGAYFMALEYVPGVDMATLLHQARHSGQPLPVRLVLYLGQQIAEGLAYAHRKLAPDGSALGVVHRDVSPHNAMVSYEGEVKLIDFGLAKSAAKSRKTQAPTVMGKLGYMSPEQVRAQPLDARTDIYSCGVMLWEMLAGRPLIAEGSVGEMLAAMAYPKVPSLLPLHPGVDGALEAVLQKALAPEVENRYARADELAMALAGQLMRTGSPVSTEEVGTFVRALCPEAFAAQQRVISRLSTVNAPLKLDRVAAVIESTTIRPADPRPAEGSEAPRHPERSEAESRDAARPPSTDARGDRGPAPRPSSQLLPGDLDAVKPSRGPLFAILGAGVLLMAIGGGAGFWYLSQRQPAAKVPEETTTPALPEGSVTAAAASPAAVDPGAGATATAPAVAGEPTPATAPSAAGEPTVAADPGSAPGTASGSTGEEPAAPGGAGSPDLGAADSGPTPEPTAIAAAEPELTPPPFQPLPFPEKKKPPVAAKQATAGERGAIKGAALFSNSPLQSVTIVNLDGRGWNSCQVVLPGRYLHKLPALGAGFRREMPFKFFAVDPSVPDVKGVVLVKCAQGSMQHPLPF